MTLYNEKVPASRPVLDGASAGGGSLRLSRTMLVLILVTCILLMSAGLIPVGWTTAAQDQSSGLGGTVPTRTPAPTLDKKIYLPILARSWAPTLAKRIYLPILTRSF